MQNIRVANYLFFVVAALDILGIALKEPLLVYISKPFVIPVLWLLYKMQVKKPNYFYSIALFCSFVGDMVLMFDGLNFFMLGLVSFLITHVFFILIIKKRIRQFSKGRLVALSIPFLILVAALIALLETEGLEDLFFPVTTYAFVIAVFGTFALYHFTEEKNKISHYMLLGALLFMGSDTLLAINAFYKTLHLFNLLVMLTYIAAQYNIYKSMVRIEPTSTSDQ